MKKNSLESRRPEIKSQNIKPNLSTHFSLRGYLHVTVTLKWFTLILWHLYAVVTPHRGKKENLEGNFFLNLWP